MQDELSILRNEVARARRGARNALIIAVVACGVAVALPIVRGASDVLELRGADGVTTIRPGRIELEQGDGRVVLGTVPLPHMQFELGGQPWLAAQVSRTAEPEGSSPKGVVLVRSRDDEVVLEPRR